MNILSQQHDINQTINELKQKLNADAHLLATDANQNICGRLSYLKEKGVFLYSPYLGENLFEDGKEISVEEAAYILEFEAQLQVQLLFDKLQKKNSAAEFLHVSN